MAYITTQDGTELFCRDWGAGKPVVLIHGWPLSGDMWEHQANYLAEHGCRVINYDRRGFGRSGQPWNGFDYDTFASDLSDVMEAFEIRNATLVGSSMGGGEVVRYLSRYGASRVSGAVLMSAVTPFLLKTDDNPDGVDAKTFTDIEEQLRKDRPAFLKDFGPKFYGRSMVNHTVSDADLEWTQTMALQGSLRATIAAAKAWSTTDFRSDMAAITVPVRVIHGTSDHTIPIDVSGRRSAKMLSNVTVTEYNGEPHGLFLTAKDRLNEELLAFAGGSSDPVTAADVS